MGFDGHGHDPLERNEWSDGTFFATETGEGKRGMPLSRLSSLDRWVSLECVL